jgi:hypothetical protein
MKKFALLFIGLIVLSLILITGCSANQTTTTTVAAPVSSTTSAGTILTVINGSKTATYSLADLKALTSVSGWGGMSTMHGNVASTQYKGVAMSVLLKAVGGMTDKTSLVVTAKDNYTRTLSYDQVVNGNFSVSDLSGNSVTPSTKPVLCVVYEQSRAALDSDSGPIMLGIMTAQNQLTGGDNWVKEVCKIEVVSAP